MIAGNHYSGLPADIWSCGVILYALVCGFLPFEDPDTAALYKKIMDCDYEVPEFVSRPCKDLLRNILNVDPEDRYTIKQIRNHKWCELAKTSLPLGILIGYQPMPVNQSVIKNMKKFGYDRDYAKKCVEANRHNQITSLYYLLMKQMGADAGEPEPIPSKKSPYVVFPPNFRHRRYLDAHGNPVAIHKSSSPPSKNNAVLSRTRRYVSSSRYLAKDLELVIAKPKRTKTFRRTLRKSSVIKNPIGMSPKAKPSVSFRFEKKILS